MGAWRALFWLRCECCYGLGRMTVYEWAGDPLTVGGVPSGFTPRRMGPCVNPKCEMSKVDAGGGLLPTDFEEVFEGEASPWDQSDEMRLAAFSIKWDKWEAPPEEGEERKQG